MSELSKIVNKATDAIINGQVLSTEGINDLAKIFYAAANKIIEAGGSAGLHREIVSQLPTQDIDDNTIYMVLDPNASGSDIYDEWMWIENAWEHIGSTRVDLSDYYTKTEVDTALDNSKIAVFTQTFSDVTIERDWGALYQSEQLQFDISSLGLQSPPKAVFLGVTQATSVLMLVVLAPYATRIPFYFVRPSQITKAIDITATALVIY